MLKEVHLVYIVNFGGRHRRNELGLDLPEILTRFWILIFVEKPTDDDSKDLVGIFSASVFILSVIFCRRKTLAFCTLFTGKPHTRKY